jgi:hypothetical protein
MRIVIEDPLMIKLMAIANATAPQEFSGMGFCKIKGEDIVVYDFVLCNIGNTTYTEIPTELMLKLMHRPDSKNMKVWLHRHPMGSGIPGDDNWSGTDVNTAVNEPLGGIPELVRWSVAIVLTPRGWVGRIDNHIKHETRHLEVFPQLAGVYQDVDAIRPVRAAFQQGGWEETLGDAEYYQEMVDGMDDDELAKIGVTKRYVQDLFDEGQFDEIDGILDRLPELEEEEEEEEDVEDGFIETELHHSTFGSPKIQYVNADFGEVQDLLNKQIIRAREV